MIYLLYDSDEESYELLFKPDGEDNLYDIHDNHNYYFDIPPRLTSDFDYDNCGCESIETYLTAGDGDITLIGSFTDVDTYNTYLDEHPELLL